MLELLLWPFIAGVVLTGIHAYFGLHVLARGIVFVDLSLAQVAALGITIAILAGHTVDSQAAYWYALAFSFSGAVLFAVARRYEHAIQQEVVIGIVYAVCSALGVLALDRAPQGAEHIKQILIGSILTVDARQVAHLAILYAAVGLVHWLLRRPLIQASFFPDQPSSARFVWDVVFYGSFAMVVTSSVRIAGVLLVFSYLIVPAAIAALLAKGIRARLLLAWVLGVVITAVGLAASWAWDLPTGPAIVAAFGAAIALTGIGFGLRVLSARMAGRALALAVLAAGTLLVLFPHMDQPWLDALERAVPQMQTAFLDEDDRATRLDAIDAIQRGQEELAMLRARQQDVNWGKLEMSDEMQERLRQYLAGRGEIVAGDQLVLKDLAYKARDSQRLLLGLPLMLIGATGTFLLFRRRRPAGIPVQASAPGPDRNRGSPP
jgi:zinc/manganese transport system permease protein